MAHQLTTRAKALDAHRALLLTMPTSSVQSVSLYNQSRAELLKGMLRLLVGALFLAVLGAALYPGGDTHPLRVAEEVPSHASTWYGSDYLN